MTVPTHGEARKVIHREHLKVKEVVSTRRGTRYNCLTQGKKGKRKPITICVPKDAPESNHPTNPNYRPTKKELNKR